MKVSIEHAFEAIGARVKVHTVPNGFLHHLRGDRERTEQPVRIDIVQARDGQAFDIALRWNVKLSVGDTIPDDRHLLLIAEHVDYGFEQFSRFLCGHDERAWFVAAIPESAEVATVQEAKDALKPQEVWDAIREFEVPMEDRDLRWTNGFIRQGEWFFLPRPCMEVDSAFILRNEPIQRGGGKPHWCEFVYRTGGEIVWVNHKYPNGLTREEYVKLDASERRPWGWREMTRNADVYANGLVRHPDHHSIVLPYWHKVVMNTETRSKAMEHVAFLD
jgi:hypothetical protein